MNKKALLALLVALLIPLLGYLFVKVASTRAIDMPRKYLLDSVQTRVEDGKMITDSIWHQTANITLVNQLGDTVSLYDIQNKVIVADFFFTSCGSICPTLTSNMAKLQRSFSAGGNSRQKIDTSIVQFLSFTIDPERDSVSRLKQYADKYGAIHDNWWFLTGPKKAIYDFAFEQLKVDKFSDEPVDPNFVHTNRFVLMDKHYVVRGFYDGLDSLSLRQLARDIGLLMLEKDSMSTEPLPFDPVTMGIFAVLTVIVVTVGLRLIFKKKTA